VSSDPARTPLRRYLPRVAGVLEAYRFARGLAAKPMRLFGNARAVRDGYRFARSLQPPTAGATLVRPPDNPLATFFDGHTEGPGLWKWRHYFDIYHRHFAKFVGREVHIVEIGIYSGGSLAMWRHYFGDGARLYGVDIEEACRAYEADDVRVFIGDQADPLLGGVPPRSAAHRHRDR
jgi:hypothetical protein